MITTMLPGKYHKKYQDFKTGAATPFSTECIITKAMRVAISQFTPIYFIKTTTEEIMRTTCHRYVQQNTYTYKRTLIIATTCDLIILVSALFIYHSC